MLRIGIVAGESSGDQLGALLMDGIRERYANVRFEGMAGPRMVAAGCTALASIDELSIMGIVEVARRLPRLWLLRERLVRHFLANPPDVFVGIDVPDFVLGIEKRLKRRGVRTVHYVAPQVWAWRERRAAGLAECVDLLLAVLPFEVEFFERHAVPVRFVGHPLADAIPAGPCARDFRAELGVTADQSLVALLPGSRSQEIARLAGPFVRAARLCHEQRPGMIFVAAALNPAGARIIARRHRDLAPDLPLRIVAGRTRAVLGASDAAIVASGTATLEAMLLKTPMVVAYQVAPLSYVILRRLVRVPFIAMPNILARRALVPEFLQAEVKPATLARAVMGWLDDPERVGEYRRACAAIHAQLARQASRQAADSVLGVVRARPDTTAGNGA